MKAEVHESRSTGHMEKFITHSVSFSEINKIFEYMLKRDDLRCIIRMRD
ncbi:hypothetical protein AMTRI_Chr12g236810 [Amborella trichopoda]